MDNKQPIHILLIAPPSEHLQKLALYIEKLPAKCIWAELEGIEVTLEFSSPAPEIVVFDVAASGINAQACCQKIQGNLRTRMTPLVLYNAPDNIQTEIDALTAGAADYIRAPFDLSLVCARIRLQHQLQMQYRQLINQLQRRTREHADAERELIQRLRLAMEFKQSSHRNHGPRCAGLVGLLARASGCSESEAMLLQDAAPLHDLGHIGVPEYILQKNTPLTAEETRLMRQHPAIGAGLIGKHEAPVLKLARRLALGHHEHWDGTGYPHGLRGENIPISARIMAVCDMFDALISDRPYRPEYSLEQAFDTVNAAAGRVLDPTLVSLFLQKRREIVAMCNNKTRIAENVDARMSLTLI